jgi:valyl-tRNA synthetase
MIKRYSADAVRYWAASTALGKDAVISEEKIRLGGKLITKLWNVARFSQPFLGGTPISPGTLTGTSTPSLPSTPQRGEASPPKFTLADRWILSRTQHLVRRVTSLMEDYEYAAAKSEAEEFFWRSFTDNYLEMCKQRLYDLDHSQREASLYTLQHVFLTLLKLFAPFLPHVTEAIYQELFAGEGFDIGKKEHSIHLSDWPEPDPSLEDIESEEHGDLLVEIATAVRRYKSEHGLPLGSELNSLQLATRDAGLKYLLQLADADLRSVTRARQVRIVEYLEPEFTVILEDKKVRASINL